MHVYRALIQLKKACLEQFVWQYLLRKHTFAINFCAPDFMNQRIAGAHGDNEIKVTIMYGLGATYTNYTTP